MKTTLLAGAGLAVAFAAGWAAAPEAGRVDRFFEIRTYTTHPGKLAGLHKRFRDHTNRLFIKHGMQLVGYWTPAEGPGAENTLVYLLAYENKETREAAWKGFLNDPVWKKAFKDSRADGPIVKKVEKMFLLPTDYSPIR